MSFVDNRYVKSFIFYKSDYFCLGKKRKFKSFSFNFRNGHIGLKLYERKKKKYSRFHTKSFSCIRSTRVELVYSGILNFSFRHFSQSRSVFVHQLLFLLLQVGYSVNNDQNFYFPRFPVPYYRRSSKFTKDRLSVFPLSLELGCRGTLL